MELTHAQKSELYHRGLVRIPGVIPRAMVDAALKAINHSVGEGMNVADMPKYRAQSYCPDIAGTRVITDLFNKTPVFDLCESLVGEGNLAPAKGGQVALRFPILQDPPPVSRPHIDGMHSPNNGVPEGVISNFTMLVGVYLSDLPNPNAGNFTVWPGTHHTFEAYFRDHGAEALLQGMPKVEMPQPEQVLGAAGDVMLVHYQLAHSVGPNTSPHTRYAIFFRVKHPAHTRDNWQVPMLDIWKHWPGMTSFIESIR